MVMLQFSHGIYSLKVVFLRSAVSLGWWLHLYTRLGFNPSACAFMGFGAEILVPGFDELRIMERVGCADLSELLVQFIGILFQFVIADTALHRSREVPTHEAQRKAGLAEELAEDYARPGTGEESSRGGKATALLAAETGTGRSETEQPTAIALRMDGPGNEDAIL